MRWFYILVLTIALTHTVSVRAADPTQAKAAVDAEQKNVDNSNKKFAEKLEEAKKAEEAAKKDPKGKQGDKTNEEIYEEKKKELAEAALDKVNADNALKAAQDRQTKLQGDPEGEHGHHSQGGSQASGKSEGDKAKEKAMAEAMKQAAAKEQQEEQKDEKKEEDKPKEEATQTAEKEKPAQNSNQEEQVATIPEDIKNSLQAPYAKEDDSNASAGSSSEKPSSNGYDDLIKANNEFAAAKAKETSETLASLNAEKDTTESETAAAEEKAAAKPVSVNDYIDGVVAQNSTSTRSPASAASGTTTYGTAKPRAMKGTSSSRLLNSIK
jgi:hypothetical protein